MNFLKISGLVLGTGSVVGSAGTGIYYSVRKNAENAKTKFVGKLVFFKKSGDNTNTLYEAKLLNDSEYNKKILEFDNGKTEQEKHSVVNKVVEISYELNVQKAKSILKEIFGTEITLQNAKTKVSTEKVKDLKDLLGETIYTNLISKLGS